MLSCSFRLHGLLLPPLIHASSVVPSYRLTLTFRKGTLGNLKAGIQRKEKDLLRTMAHFRTTTWLAEHRALLIRASCTKSWRHYWINTLLDFLNLSLYNASPIRALTHKGRSTRPAWKVILIPRGPDKLLRIYSRLLSAIKFSSSKQNCSLGHTLWHLPFLKALQYASAFPYNTATKT